MAVCVYDRIIVEVNLHGSAAELVVCVYVFRIYVNNSSIYDHSLRERYVYEFKRERERAQERY